MKDWEIVCILSMIILGEGRGNSSAQSENRYYAVIVLRKEGILSLWYNSGLYRKILELRQGFCSLSNRSLCLVGIFGTKLESNISFDTSNRELTFRWGTFKFLQWKTNILTKLLLFQTYKCFWLSLVLYYNDETFV